MVDITEIDENFAVKTKVEKDNLCYYDTETAPFKIYGVKRENGKFRRLPEAVAAKVNDGVFGLHTNTAGGRVRFVSDSPFVAIHAVIEGIPHFNHMPLTGVAGLDLYAKEEGVEKYIGSFIPPCDMEGGYESIINFTDKKERIVTVNFPLYSSLTKLYIGLEEGASLKEAPAYTYEKPVVSYGSSITQGGCASRPGNCYQHFLTREFDCNHWNLGFSGSARAEDTIIDWIKLLDMSVFLYDYDHNAPNVEHLQATHEKMFCAVREAQPDLPIIIMSRPKYYLNNDEKKRLKIIRTTYENAIAAGDKNVYFIDGHTLMADIKDNGTVDNCHPTDSGFASMARAIAPILGKLLIGGNHMNCMKKKMQPLDYAKEACDTMIRKYRGEDLPPKGRFHYHQGVFLSGVFQTYQLCKDEKYFQYIKEWVDSIINEEGEINTFNKGELDDIQPGILLYPLLDKTEDSRYKKALDTLLAIVREFRKNKVGGFWHKDCFPDQMWLDGLYMAGPICAEYASRFDEPEYLDIAVEQALLMREKTEDKKTGLWYHAWDCSKSAEWADRETGLSSEFWGRSIGWVPVAILNELDYIPEDYEKRPELEALVRDLLKALCLWQSQEGRWYQVVDKGEKPGNWLENSCSCLYTAAICKAVRKGILGGKYLEQARKGYEGVIRSLEFEGKDIQIGHVCIGTGVGDYKHYCERPVSINDLHGVGAFLIMCTEAQMVWKEMEQS